MANAVLEYIKLSIRCILKQLLGVKISGLWFKQFQKKKNAIDNLYVMYWQSAWDKTLSHVYPVGPYGIGKAKAVLKRNTFVFVLRHYFS